MMGILQAGGYFEQQGSAPAAVPDDPLAQLPMQAL